jgi:carboxymethylenebutenolidase
MAQSVTVDSAGESMKLFEVKPEGVAKGAVIVIQEAFGITDHIQDVCKRLADAGYVAVAPHVFHRTGDPVVSYDKMGEVVPHIMGLNREGIDADLNATLEYLAANGFTGKQVGIMGFCMGGTIAFYEGTQRALGAAVTFYGGGIVMGRFGLPALIELVPELKTPWIGNYGDMDQSIPLTEVDVLRRAVEPLPVATEVNRYADADHGFHCNDRSAFHEASSKAAWAKTIAFLDANVGAN